MIDISQLPEWAKIEIKKEDLLAFAEKLREEGIPGQTPPSKTEEDVFFDFLEMCDFLGIAQSTGYQRVSRGEIPHFKKGRRLYFRKSELLAWVESGRRKTTEDLNEIAEQYLRATKTGF
ncbi:helix-turn-helix domain-containing protein [Lewinella sp. LCG006]|uniref:helix-turn-helix domain-containing protein n=1 Tax=Lewinella sp. LCG006 TaxID=3231911 RepID=UPI0034610623